MPMQYNLPKFFEGLSQRFLSLLLLQADLIFPSFGKKIKNQMREISLRRQIKFVRISLNSNDSSVLSLTQTTN